MPAQHTVSPLNRRHFLKLSGLAAGLLAVAPMVPAFDKLTGSSDLEIDGKRYRGTADGRILLSRDSGLTWQEIAYFGGTVHIESLTADEQGTVKAHLRDNLHRFWVQSSNDRSWLTANYRPPSAA